MGRPISRERDGRWYTLSYREFPEPALLVHILKQNLDKLSDIAERMRESGSYDGEVDMWRGFGPGFLLAAEGGKGEYLTLAAKPTVSNRREVATALSTLFHALDILRCVPECDGHVGLQEQLLVVRTVVGEYAHLSGHASASFARWLFHARTQDSLRIPVIHAMWQMRNQVRQSKTSEELGGPHRYMHADCISWAQGCVLEEYGATLYVGSHTLDDTGGYEMACHNVDSVVHQLPLLAGLCVLYEYAARALDTQPPH